MLCVAPSAMSRNAEPALVGLWLTEDQQAVISIERCPGGDFCGRLVSFVIGPQDEGKPQIDDRNPDPALRGRPLCGLPMLGGFRPAGGGELSDGWIYNPNNGKTYAVRMTLDGDTRLRLRGYVLMPLFGETQIWTRSAPVAPCSPPPR